MTKALVVAATAVLIGLAVGSFVFFTSDAQEPLPAVTLPSDDAVLALQEQVSARPDDADGQLELGLAATQQAIATADPAWYAVAEDALDAAVEMAPQSAAAHVALGQLQLSLHQFATAYDTGVEAARLSPGLAPAWGVVVDAQVELGDYDEAAESLQVMLDLRPDLPALARASYLRQLNGDLDGAILAMRQAQTAGGGAQGQGSGVSALLGDLLLQRGDLEGAREVYESTPTAAAAAGLARIAAAEGDTDRALRILQQLADTTPQPPVVLALAEVQARVGDEEGLASTVELARTLALLQQDAGQVVDLELALFEASHGDPDRAVELAEAAHAARPDNVFAAGALAWALHQAGQDDLARPLAEQATRLGTVDTAHELRMAEVLGDDDPDVLSRNPLARELFLP